MPKLEQTRRTVRIKSQGAKPDLITTQPKSVVNSNLKQRYAEAERRLQTEKDPKVIAKLHEILANLQGYAK